MLLTRFQADLMPSLISIEFLLFRHRHLSSKTSLAAQSEERGLYLLAGLFLPNSSGAWPSLRWSPASWTILLNKVTSSSGTPFLFWLSCTCFERLAILIKDQKYQVVNNTFSLVIKFTEVSDSISRLLVCKNGKMGKWENVLLHLTSVTTSSTTPPPPPSHPPFFFSFSP